VPEGGNKKADQQDRIPRLGHRIGGRQVVAADQAEDKPDEPQAKEHQRGGGQALLHEMLGAGLGGAKAAHVLQGGTETAHAAPPFSAQTHTMAVITRLPRMVSQLLRTNTPML